MSPKTGRPPKQGVSRTEKLNIRLTPEEAKRIDDCAAILCKARTDVIMDGITLLERDLKKE